MLIHDIPKRKFLPQLERSEPLIKDHTATQYFRDCKRKYFYAMVAGRRPKSSEMQNIWDWGSGVHKFIEEYSMHFDYDKAVAAAIPVSGFLNKNRLPMPKKWEHLDSSRFEETMIALAKFFDQEKKDGYIHTESVEAPFNLELPDGSVIGGRMDAVLRFSGGQVWVRDHKTSTKPAMWFIKGLDPNDQATRYVYAMSRMLGWNSKDQQVSKKANGLEYLLISNEANLVKGKRKPQISRHPITKSNEQLVNWERQQMFRHIDMALHREHDEWPMEEGSQCQWCDYVSVCRAPTEENMRQRLQSDFLHQPWDHQTVEQKER
jgi:hypothetical protein